MGNIRLSYTLDPVTNVLKILVENHYYPFGLKHTNYSTSRKSIKKETEFNPKRIEPVVEDSYKYNGKEWQDELGLNFYDYGARNYDPAIGRWMNIDPLAEQGGQWSPYNYAINNPVYYIDPDGMWIHVNDGGTEYRYNNGKLFSRNKETGMWDVEENVTSGYAFEILEALRLIGGGDQNSFGSAFLRLFENNTINAVISQNPKADKNESAGHRIFTSDKEVDKVQTTDGPRSLIFHITIAHELAHIIENNLYDRKVTNKEWYPAFDANGQKVSVKYGEVFATMYENMIRAEQDLPLRTHYSFNRNGTPDSRSKLIEKSEDKNPFTTTYQPTKEVLRIWNLIIASRLK